MNAETIIEMGGKSWRVSLHLAQVFALAPVIGEIATKYQGYFLPGAGGERLERYMGLCFTVIEAALSKHHPDLNQQKLSDLIGIFEADRLAAQVMMLIKDFCEELKDFRAISGGKLTYGRTC